MIKKLFEKHASVKVAGFSKLMTLTDFECAIAEYKYKSKKKSKNKKK